MTSFLKNYLVVLHAFLFAIVSVSWFVNGSAYRSLQALYIEYKSDYISDMKVSFDDNKVYLNIHMKHSETCKQVISDLNIGNILVGANTYKPECVVINNTHIRIVYTKITEL